MKLNTRYAAVVGAAVCTALLISYAAADPGHGHAYGHSQASTSRDATSGVAGSTAQLFPGDGIAAPTFKNATDFFTSATTEKSHGHDHDQNFVPPSARDSAMDKNDPASQFLNTTSAGSNASAVTSSATSKPSSGIDAAAQQPEWLINATSSRPDVNPKPSATPGGTHPSPSPTQDATPGTTQSPSPAPTGTPFPTDVPDVFPTATPEGHIMPPGMSGGD